MTPLSPDFGPSAPPHETVAILGAGAWGAALGILAARAGRDVRLWGRDAAAMDAMARTREIPALPDIAPPASLQPTGDLAAALRGADAVLLVTPSHTVREMCRAIAALLEPGAPVVLCAKGVEAGTGLLLTDVAEEELPGHPIGALSGPTFAREAALGHPSAATIAFTFTDAEHAHPERSEAARIAVALGSERFRPYVSDDPAGVEVGGAVKNVIAIACGMMTGAGFGANTRAALVVRGMSEMKRLAVALGGRAATVSGLSGAGDLSMTCASPASRNMSLGVQLGEGTARADCFEGRPVVVEGERAALAVTDLARRLDVAMPVCEAVRRVLHEGADMGETFAALWSMPLEAEAPGMNMEIDHPADAAAVQAFAEVIS
jgi:glycerol-3-phosphate dehydrogenase (NAD(P)+)